MKTPYWIVDAEGVYARVEGADQRDSWVRVWGWREASEPGPGARVHVVHPEVGHGGPMPFEALSGAWSGLGWKPGPPPEPADLTKDPRLVDQPVVPAAEPDQKPTTKAVSGKTTQES